MQLIELPLGDILVPPGRRRLRGLEELAASIREFGLLNPITVTRERVLVAGYHRLEACRSLGWKEIHASILMLSELDAQLAEIDENLIRNELTVLERAEVLLRRKELFEAKHPEARQHVLGGKARQGAATEIISFAADTASKARVSQRTIQHEILIARRLDEKAKEAIRETPVADSKTDLLLLARMTPNDQRAVAERVAAGKATGVKQAARDIRREHQVEAIRQYNTPGGKFGVIVVDPPWPYASRIDDVTHRGTIPYSSLTMEEICSLAIPADDNCVLWLWTTNAFMRDAFRAIDAWGFREKTILTWVKDRMGVGNWLRGQTEHCILAIKGNPVMMLTNQSTVLHAPVREHSRKPAEFYALVESLCPARDRLDLFAREQRPGWACIGAEAMRFQTLVAT